MDVSIIIVNYNTFDLTSHCITSIRDHTLGCSYEIIVVDNASKEDPTRLKEFFPEVELVRSNENLGFAGGNNLGLAKAKGEFILLLNSDTEIIEGNDAISRSVEYLRDHDQVGVVSARLEYPGGKHQSAAQRFPGIKYKLFEALRFQKFMSKEKRGRVMLGAFFDHNSTVEADWVWGTFFMFRRKMLEDLPDNKLNADYFMYGEDIQWCIDFRALGWSVMYFHEAKVLHHMGGSNAAKEQHIKESTRLLMKKNYSALERTIVKFLDILLG